jgi:hypothetical protein
MTTPPVPCNFLKFKLSFPTIENENYYPFMRATIVDEIVNGIPNETPLLYKHTDTKKFQVKFHCGNSTNLEEFSH